MDWFTVNKEGLAKLLMQRGPAFIVYEIYQNSADARKTSTIEIRLEKPPGSQYALLSVVDDSPDGFRDLAESWTLFAESSKKGDAEKRGWMNLGEKLVLACCREARITSTTGTVKFDARGRHRTAHARPAGTEFAGELKLTREQMDQAIAAVHRLLVPDGVTLTINGEPVPPRKPSGSETPILETRIANAEGEMTRTKRRTRIEMVEPLPGETAMLYEMGIPVVETGDRWHVNVHQKVPLNSDRDNVPPSYLREIRTHVLNTMHRELTPEQARERWVREATSSPNVEAQAFRHVMTQRFGEQCAAQDPSDREAENGLKARGHTIVAGGSLTPDEWENNRRFEAILPAGRILPSPKPFTPGGEPLNVIPLSDYSHGMRWFSDFAHRVGSFLLGRQVIIRLVDNADWGYKAAWSRACDTMHVNVAALGREYFATGPHQALLDLMIHEFAHDAGHHLEESYHEAATAFGARLTNLALHDREFFLRGIP